MAEAMNDYDDLLEDAKHRWRNRLIGIVVLAALIAVGAYALWDLVLSNGGSSAEGTQTATVERGSITNTLSTSGVAVAQSTAELSFGQSGLVTAVNVSLGQEVEQGDVLAETESDELESALVTAEVNLNSAQAKLDELLEGSSESDLASADQSLLQAQANYDQAERALEDLLDGPSETDLLSAEQSVSSAESQLAKAEESLANLYSTSEDDIAAAEEALSKAEEALEDAKDATASAADSLALDRASLYSAETAYCDDGTDGLSFCKKLAAPVSSADEDILLDVVATDEQDRATQASQVLSANMSYKNARESKLGADDAVESAEADIEAAEDDLEEAKQGPSSADIASAEAEVASAQLSLDLASEDLAELLAGPTQEDLDDAQSNLDQAAAALVVAQAKWEDAYAGADSADIDAQRDQVRQAELSVENARKDLEKAQIIAPFDGTVAALNIEVGQEVGGETAIILNTPDALRLDLVISETDLPYIEAGQSGFATFDALESGMFPFVIDSIGTNPTSTQGIVTYEASATLQTERSPEAMREFMGGALGGRATAGTDAPDTGDIPSEADAPDIGDIPSEALQGFAGSADTAATPLPGMSASLTIIVDQVQDVLVAPTQAVQTEGFQSVVEVLNDDGSIEKVVVQTGVTDGTSTEITEGLEEGQTVIVPSGTAISTQTTTDTGFQEGGFPGGGFEGGFPGGAAPQQGGAP